MENKVEIELKRIGEWMRIETYKQGKNKAILSRLADLDIQTTTKILQGRGGGLKSFLTLVFVLGYKLKFVKR